MFTQPAPSPPTLATSTSPVSPASPQRPSRLRGLSYLRNYTQNHLHSRDSNNDGASSPRRLTLARATSYPTPSSTTSGNKQGGTASSFVQSPAQPAPSSTPISAADRNSYNVTNQESTGSTSSWLPTVDGQSGISRIATQPQSISANSPSVSLPGSDNRGEIHPLPTMGRSKSAITGRAAISEVAHLDGSSDAQSQLASAVAPYSHGAESGIQLPSIRFSQHQDVRAPRPSLAFSPIGRTLPTGREIIRVGRYSERDNQPNPASNVPSAAPVGFKSKVVSRRHCELWCENGQWFIKDVKSSSGTFLNHVRLSSPGTESKPFPVKDGDIVQLGIDFKGGEEMIFRCVKIRIELNRGWQNALNSFNVASHKRLRNMAKQLSATSGSSSQDCTICLGAVAPCQSLFVAPCSHTWHYKCVRRIINGPTWPTFICPNCRAVADLEADVEDPFPDAEWEENDPADMEKDPVDAPIPQANITPSVQVQGTGRANSSSEHTTHGIPEHDAMHDATGDDTTGSDSELQQAMNHLGIVSHNDSGPIPRQESYSLTAPVNIRVGRSSARTENGSNPGAAEYNLGSLRSDRTPSPNARVPDIISGHDGPLTPRNDAGPFIFDGSAGRAAGARISALDLSGVPQS